MAGAGGGHPIRALTVGGGTCTIKTYNSGVLIMEADSIPYSELRAHLAETLERLEARDEPLYISRRGAPAGVLLSVAQYRRLRGDDLGFADAMLAWRERHAAALAAEAAAGDDPDPFADVRDRGPAVQ
jgi:prevent-host-death family protein